MSSLLGRVNLIVDFFPFSTLNISCHFLLAYRVSVDRSSVNHMGFSLYVTCCFSLAVFNSLSLTQNTFFVFNLCCRFFCFSTLNISCHSLLAFRVSAERSDVKHMGFPLYATSCFFLAVFNILFCV